MGFPLGYTNIYLPELLLHIITILDFLRKLISTLLTLLGHEDFLEPEFSSPTRPESCSVPRLHSVSAALIREILPVVKYSEIVDPPEKCAVCLYEFELDDEIRRLRNCKHVFHRSCVDRWMDHDQMTCPLCRAVFVPDDMMEAFNEKLWLASGVSDYYEEYSSTAAGELEMEAELNESINVGKYVQESKRSDLGQAWHYPGVIAKTPGVAWRYPGDRPIMPGVAWRYPGVRPITPGCLFR